MRMVVSLLGIVMALAIVALLVKQQLQPPAARPVTPSAATLPEGVVVPQVNAGNAQQVQAQIKRDLEQALQAAPREIPE